MAKKGKFISRGEAERRAGRLAADLARRGLTARRIVTKESFENAILVHGAISGATNTRPHLRRALTA